ncbi:outer membrane beta-barrel protein [Roseibium algae]|uniref:Outer membrane beta-barrel protein n=1 Tax=Roseibium algae TaxID=3123038 RepID=A0ABU8TH94_9HYPH
MLRQLPFLVSFLVLSCTMAVAQDLSSDLRGGVSFSDEDTLSAVANSAESPDNSAGNGAGSDTAAADAAINAAIAEDDSTGLGTAGRVVPARPFADRIAAVRGVQSASGAVQDDGVFGGDTNFDQASGLRLGRFTILPEITITGGWTDNTAQTQSGTSGQLYRISPNITATSNWSRHQLDFALRGTYVGYPDQRSDDNPSLTASTALRLDLNSLTTVNGSAAYTYSREDNSSAESSGGNDDVHQLSTSLGVTRDAGLVGVTLRGALDRNIYTAGDAGTPSSARDNTLYSVNLRLDTNTGATFSPFTEGSLLVRRYDNSCSDALCEDRNANGYQLRGGVAIATGSKLSGEVGAGWRIEDLEDERLENLQGLIVDASLVWSPTRLTTITGGLGTSFEATDIDGASGSIIYSGDLRLAHEFSDRIVGETGIGYSYRTYQGASIEEETLTGLVGLTYALTQNIALQTRYNYRKFTGSDEVSDYSQNSIEAGLRFRH